MFVTEVLKNQAFEGNISRVPEKPPYEDNHVQRIPFQIGEYEFEISIYNKDEVKVDWVTSPPYMEDLLQRLLDENKDALLDHLLQNNSFKIPLIMIGVF
jgi:hypothetical protein